MEEKNEVKNFLKVLTLENIEFRLQDFLFVHRWRNSRTSMIKFFPPLNILYKCYSKKNCKLKEGV